MRLTVNSYSVWIALLVCWQLGERTLEAGLIWDAGGDGISFFQEANWGDEVTGLDPPAGTIDGRIEFDLKIDFGTIGGDFDTSSGVSANIGLDFNRKLTVNGGSLNLRNDISVIGAAGEDFGFSHLEMNGGKMDAFRLRALKVQLSGDAELILHSSTTTLTVNSTINFTSLDSSILFTNKSAASLADEIAATTVFGQPAVVGQNLMVTNQGSGALMQVGTPEPSTLVVTAIGVGLLAIHSRRAKSAKARLGCP